MPRRDRLERHPHRQAAAVAQRDLVLPPVLHPVPGFRDLVAAGLVMLVRHRNHRPRCWRQVHHPTPATYPAARCRFAHQRREQVLGLEVVLADGTIVNGLKGLIKDNSGYDLKQLFIGSEGTLGIVTRAVLRLRPLMASRSTALITFQRFEQVLIFLRWIEARLGGTLSAFELMWQSFFAAVTRHSGGIAGLPPDAPFYALVEAEGGDSEQDDAGFLAAMEAALEQGLFEDAVIAKSAGEREALWAIREDIDILMRMGDRIDFDVSLPTSGMAAYLDHVQNRLATEVDDCTLVVFGHIADNNLHAMAIRSCPFAADERHLIKAIMYEQLRAAGGSVSAEHGIGLDKKAALPVTRTSAELALMRRIKRCMDPHDLLNPGKIVDLAASD